MKTDDDIFGDDNDQQYEKKMFEQESNSMKKRAVNYGVREIILNEMDEYDTDQVEKGFANGFNDHFGDSSITGQLEILRYIVNKMENHADLEQKLNSVIADRKKDDIGEKINEIKSLVKARFND